MLPRIYYVLAIILCMVGLNITLYLKYTGQIKAKKIATLKNIELKDSLLAKKGEIEYLHQLSEIKTDEKQHINSEDIFVSELGDGSRISLKDVLGKSGRLVLRYTEIGCQSCMDSTINIIKEYKDFFVSSKQPIVLVDFEDLTYALKWKHVTNIEYPVYHLLKGKLPLLVENSNSSYCFIIENDVVNNIFMPKNNFPNYIRKYYSDLRNN